MPKFSRTEEILDKTINNETYTDAPGSRIEEQLIELNQILQNGGASEERLDVLEARMDEFASLDDGSTTGDAELMDIRVQADGTTANSAGTAVRNQITELKNDLEAIVPGLSEEAKEALLDCFAHVAWIDEHGQDYYDALEEALNGTPTPTPAEYITDGLVAYWDAIDNYATGTHNPSAEKWVDLINNYELDKYGSAEWGSNYATISSGNYFSSLYLWPFLTDSTIEVVLAMNNTGDAQDITSFDGEIVGENTPRNSRKFCLYTDNTVGVIGNSSKTYLNPINNISLIRKIVATYSDYVADSVYINGLLASMGNATHSLRTHSSKYQVGIDGSLYAPNGKIYAIRIYNRKLSSTEIAINGAYDNERFNLGI